MVSHTPRQTVKVFYSSRPYSYKCSLQSVDQIRVPPASPQARALIGWHTRARFLRFYFGRKIRPHLAARRVLSAPGLSFKLTLRQAGRLPCILRVRSSFILPVRALYFSRASNYTIITLGICHLLSYHPFIILCHQEQLILRKLAYIDREIVTL